MQKIIFPDGEELAFIFERKRIKRINLRVRRDGSVYVSAPLRTPTETVERFIREQREFIRRARAEMAHLAPFADGCTVFYLGEPYRLCALKGKRGLTFANGKAILSLPDPTAELEKEYTRALAALFLPTVTARCHALEARFPHFAGRAKDIRVRAMKTMWGNCRPSEGRLTFSTALAAMPMRVVDNVVAHEYTHFDVKKHGADFYLRFAELSPDHAALDKEISRLAREYRKQR